MVPRPDAAEVEHGQGLWKRFLGKQWRAEMDAPSVPQEVDSRAVYVMSGSPAELDVSGGAMASTQAANRDLEPRRDDG